MRRANKPFRQVPQPVALRIKTVIATNNKVFFISCVVPAGGTLRSRGLPKAIRHSARTRIRAEQVLDFSTQPLPLVWCLANTALSFYLNFRCRNALRSDRDGRVRE